MDAVISGRTGRALLLDNGSLMSFDVDDPDTLVSRRQADLHFLFGDARDLRVIENADHNQIARELHHAYDCASALDLTLISLDAELSVEIRMEALELLDGLLSDSRVIENIEGILYARPLPSDGDLDGTLKLCDGDHSHSVFPLLERFRSCQQLITDVSQAWDTIPIKSFGGYKEQAEFHHVAVREGLFRLLVLTLEYEATLTSLPNQITISTFLMVACLNRSLVSLWNYRQVLKAWTKPFKKPQSRLDIRHEKYYSVLNTLVRPGKVLEGQVDRVETGIYVDELFRFLPLNIILRKLNPEDCEILYLHAVEDMKVEQIAKKIGGSRESISYRLTSIYGTIRARAQKYEKETRSEGLFKRQA